MKATFYLQHLAGTSTEEFDLFINHSWICQCIAGPKSYDSSTASCKGGKGSKGGEP